MKNRPAVVILGGGASGFFAAIHAAKANLHARIILVEKSNKLLAKVGISGGGRCNVTHQCLDPKQLINHYPRGGKSLLSVFTRFGVTETIRFFQSHGVDLKTEEDGRMFPVSNQSSSIVNCLINLAQQQGVIIRTGLHIKHIRFDESGFTLEAASERIQADRLIIATGGNADASMQDFLKYSGHTMRPSIPSLFTFNLKPHPLKERMGVSVNPVSLSIAGHKPRFQGPLLITHWGFSGPAVLKASAWLASELFRQNYRYTVLIDWLPEWSSEALLEHFRKMLVLNKQKRLANMHPEGFSVKLWQDLLRQQQLDPESLAGELSLKALRRLVDTLKRDAYEASGKTTFKEEFVTCGGVSLNDIDLKTMQSKRVKGLFFCGEITDVDGITGGFNFQYAWSSGYLAGINCLSN